MLKINKDTIVLETSDMDIKMFTTKKSLEDHSIFIEVSIKDLTQTMQLKFTEIKLLYDFLGFYLKNMRDNNEATYEDTFYYLKIFVEDFTYTILMLQEGEEQLEAEGIKKLLPHQLLLLYKILDVYLIMGSFKLND